RHAPHVEPAVGHRHHDIGAAETERAHEAHARVGVLHGLADETLTGDAEMRSAAFQQLRDLTRRYEIDLDAGQAVDLALVAARRTRPNDGEPRLGESGIALFHQAALGGQRPDELAVPAVAVRTAHGAAPCSTASSRSVWIEA